MSARLEKYLAAREANIYKCQKAGQKARAKRKPKPLTFMQRKRLEQQELGRQLSIADAICAAFWELHGYHNVSTVAVGLSIQNFFFKLGVTLERLGF